MDKTPMQNAQASDPGKLTRSELEWICLDTIGVKWPRNRRERRRVLHAMRRAK